VTTVTVILGPLSDRHWLFIFMETQIFISLIAIENVFSSSMEQMDRSVEQTPVFGVQAGETSHRTDSLSS
jgi:hypothetical protein